MGGSGAAVGPPRRGRPAAGFTFVELMVVLAIMAFAFSYAVIHLDGATGPARLSSAARQVGSTLEFLRGHAIQAARPLEMHVDIARAEWVSVMPARPSESELDRRDQEEVIVTEPIRLPRGIRFEGIQYGTSDFKTSGVLVITFSALGEMTPSGFLIRLISDEIADPDQASFSIEVNGLTGEVSHVPGYAKFEQVVSGESF